jgi:hypothetical protein
LGPEPPGFAQAAVQIHTNAKMSQQLGRKRIKELLEIEHLNQPVVYPVVDLQDHRPRTQKLWDPSSSQ